MNLPLEQQKRPSGYYYPRWDLAERLKVKAATKENAFDKVETVLGKTGDSGWPWAMTIDDIQEI